MSKLSKIIRNSFFLLGILSFSAWAKSPMALVNSVKGNAFVIKNGKETYQLKAGDHLYDFDEVLTETGGQVSFSDYYDQQYHLSGSGQVRLLNKMIELKRGYLWLQSYSSSREFLVQTANSIVSYNDGESIVSFDSFSGKTQLLVIKGKFQFANVLESYMKLEVKEGQFSFVDNEYDQGRPRNPTPLGFSSFKKVTGLFQGISPIDNQGAFERMKVKPTIVTPVRSLASVKNNNSTGATGEIIYLTRDKKKVKRRQNKLLKQYSSTIANLSKPKKRVFRPSYDKKSQAKVHVFGQKYLGNKHYAESVHSNVADSKPLKKDAPQRLPASVPEKKKHVSGNAKDTHKGPSFEDSLINAYKKQMRHSQETNELIKDLKNYKQDYKSSY